MLNMWLLKEDVSQRLPGQGKHNQEFRISMFSGIQGLLSIIMEGECKSWHHLV